jgi:hypothetical protein
VSRRRPTIVAALAASIVVSARPCIVRAQDVIDARAATYLRDQYLADLDTVHAKVMALFFAPMSVAGTSPADFGAPREKLPALEKITGKPEVLAERDRAWVHCRAQLSDADPARLTGRYEPWNATLGQAAFVMSGDLHEHLGQLIVYARSVGVKPPWST